jgi:hypothetical protein
MRTALVTLLPGASFAGGSAPSKCRTLATEILHERQVSFLNGTGPLILQVEYRETECDREPRFGAEVRALVKSPVTRGREPFLFYATETIGDPWAGNGSIRNTGSFGEMLNVCDNDSEGNAVACSGFVLSWKQGEHLEELRELKQRKYGFIVSGKNIPMTSIGDGARTF